MTKQNLLDLRSEILDQFVCQNSGNCCRADGVVYAHPNAISAMAKSLNVSDTEFLQRYVRKRNNQFVLSDNDFRPNCFLDHVNRCKVYACRPKACRTYPNWDLLWMSEESILEEAQLCGGLRLAIDKVLYK